MEKDKIILSDDELKDVSGGAQSLPPTGNSCKSIIHFEKCLEYKKWCYWENRKCKPKEGVTFGV